MSFTDTNLDPQQLLELPEYVAPAEDPTDPEVTDPSDPNFVLPANLERLPAFRRVLPSVPLLSPRKVVLSGGYVGAKSCTSGPTVGAKNLMAWFLAGYLGRGGKNLGIYNCRTVRGGSTTSLHGEGRAADLGVPLSNNWSWALADKLRAFSKELGIQCIIHYQPGVGPRIWSSSGGPGWRKYSGVANHKDHLHVELTWAAANGGLTVALLNSIFSPPAPKPAPPATGLPKHAPGSRTLRLTSPTTKGTDVLKLQQILNRWYPKLVKLVEDGDLGPASVSRVKYFQEKAGLVADGICGPASWKKLGY